MTQEIAHVPGIRLHPTAGKCGGEKEYDVDLGGHEVAIGSASEAPISDFLAGFCYPSMSREALGTAKGTGQQTTRSGGGGQRGRVIRAFYY